MIGVLSGFWFADVCQVLFTTIGSAADYGNLNKWILILSTIVYVLESWK